jgi:hypothetical protein
VSKTVIESARFANTADGYAQLTAFAARWAQRRGRWKDATGRAGHWPSGLVTGGKPVWDVPAKLAAQARMYLRGHGRKTGKDDAVSVGWPPWTAPVSFL